MAKVGAQRAAVLTGRSKSTIQRAMNSGKLSFELDRNDRRVIDVSELERVFGIKQQSLSVPAAQDAPVATAQQPLTSALPIAQAVEQEKMRMTIKMLEQQLQTAQDQIEDLKDQRDKWEKQASQVLLTSQYSQKQAEELKAQIKEREERARQRRLEIEKSRKHRGLPDTADSDVKKNSSISGEQQKSLERSQDVKRLDEQMRNLKADNENTDNDVTGSVFRFWKRAKG